MASAEARKCPNCGAAVARIDSRFCEFCGHELPRPTARPTVSPPSPYGDLEARFAALQQHADLQRLMMMAPRMAGIGCGMVFTIGFFILFVGASLFMFTVIGATGAPGFLRLVPLFFSVAGVAAAIAILRKMGNFSRAPLQREPALVAGERTEVSGGGRDSSSSTDYFITLEFPGGRRREYTTQGKVVGKVSEGDLGVAFLKGDFLLDFERLRV